jgi:hypothetical protein
MAIKLSKALATYMLVTGSALDALALGSIQFYAGTAPATADEPISGSPSPLWTVTVDGGETGISWDATIVDGGTSMALVKPSAAVWSGATTAGTVGFFRIIGVGDAGNDEANDTSEPRIQGKVSMVSGLGDFIMSNTTLTTNASATAKVISSISIALPL